MKTMRLQLLIFAVFSVDHQVNGFAFVTKNFNKKVRNYLIKPASWIATTIDLSCETRT